MKRHGSASVGLAVGLAAGLMGLCGMVSDRAFAQTPPSSEAGAAGERKPLGSLFSASSGKPAHPDLDRMQAHVQALAAHADADAAAAELRIARAAIARARAGRRAGTLGAAERDKQLAWAAIAAASRRIARVVSERERRAVQRFVGALEDELAQVTGALEAARARLAGARAAADDGERSPAEPARDASSQAPSPSRQDGGTP